MPNKVCEADVLPGLNSVALNPGDFFEQFGTFGQWLKTFLQGIFNITAIITWLQLVMWALYRVPVLYLFLRPAKSAAPKPVEVP